MSKLSEKDILHVAKLAKLTLSSEEIARYQKQLSEVVGYVEELSEVDTEGVLPTSQTTGLEDVLSADEIKAEESLSSGEALSGTDKTLNNYFEVPPLLEERGEK
jgi:aspartyl-tRNA(Asn)/glutamyl-tRNA(Gln) amidotransferase subunit C